MSRVARGLLALASLALALFESPAAAAPVQLICQSYLARADCTEVQGAWPAADPLTLVASCQECQGSGSNITCSPDEKVTAAALSLRDKKTTQAVAGAFGELKRCIGLPLVRFGGSLQGGQTYQVIFELAPHGQTVLLELTTTGGGSSGGTDGGSSGGTADGGSTPISDGATGSSDSATTGGSDAAGNTPPAGSASDGGCDCRTAASGSAPRSLLLVGLLLLVGRRRPRRRRR